MARTVEDRVEILEDGAIDTGKTVALIQQAQALRLEREKEEDLPNRMDDLEAIVQRARGAFWIVGILWLVLTTLVAILFARGF